MQAQNCEFAYITAVSKLSHIIPHCASSMSLALQLHTMALYAQTLQVLAFKQAAPAMVAASP